MKILLATPRGFCAGVDRAIEIVEQVLELHRAPIFVKHEVVHNRFVVENLRRRGAIFVEEISEVPDHSTLVFSAHGVSQEVREQATHRSLRIYDATCPLVTKVHLEVARHCRNGLDVVLIGHRGHPEVAGTMGQCPDAASRIHLIQHLDEVAGLQVRAPEQLAYVTQTTLSLDDTLPMIAALRQRFPAIIGPKQNDICYATQNRQDAVKMLAQQADLVFVVGSPNSSNSNRLREIAEKQGIPAYLVDGPEDIDQSLLIGASIIGITAGASAPEILVHRVIEQLQDWGATSIESLSGIQEHVVFSLPDGLKGSRPRNSRMQHWA